MQLNTHIMFQRGEARAAAEFYASLAPEGAAPAFDDSTGTLLATVTFAGREIVIFDSPVDHGFEITPGVSLLLDTDDAAQVDTLFERLSDGGEVLMPVGEYPFAARYGWCKDRFGVSWQVRFGAGPN